MEKNKGNSTMSCPHIFIYYNKNGNHVASELGMRKNPIPYCVLCQKIIIIYCNSSHKNICKNSHPEYNKHNPSICKHFKIKRSLCVNCGLFIKECSVMNNQKTYPHAVIKNRKWGEKYCRRCDIKTCPECDCIASSECGTCEKNAKREYHNRNGCDCGYKKIFAEYQGISFCPNCGKEGKREKDNPDTEKFIQCCVYCRNRRSFFEIKTQPICPCCKIWGGHIKNPKREIIYYDENKCDVIEDKAPKNQKREIDEMNEKVRKSTPNSYLKSLYAMFPMIKSEEEKREVIAYIWSKKPWPTHDNKFEF